MRLRLFLSVFSVLYNAVDASVLKGRQSGTSPILTPDVVQLVQKAVDVGKIPGLAVAIVHTNKTTEYGTWGIKSEDGAKMTTDVR